MASLLYLGIEGVVLRIYGRTCGQHRPRSILSAHPLPLFHPISDLVVRQHDLSIVLNTWLVNDYGFRSLIALLPDSIAHRTVGATIHGNRLHRHFIAYHGRADMLRADIKRRAPSEVTIIDASRSAIPDEYRDRSIWVPAASRRHVGDVTSRLTHLLGTTQASQS